MKHTLIENYNTDHIYVVTIGTDMGEFTGRVVCQPADYEHELKFFGYELAEMKAEIQYARAKRKFYNAQLSALTEFWRNMSNTRSYDLDAFWVKKMRETVDNIKHKFEFWTDRVQSLKAIYYERIKDFDATKKKIKICKKEGL